MGQGWIGTDRQLEHALRVVGADQDEEGRFLIYGEGVVSFLGLGEEFVVDNSAEYSIDGKRSNLQGLLNSTSYGMAVKVF